MALLQAIIIGLTALVLTPGWLFYFDITAKIAILLAGTAATLFCTGRTPRWFSILVLASLLSLAASTALSSNPALSLFGTNWRRFGAVTQAAVLLFAWTIAGHAAGHPERIRTILRGISFASALSAAYGISQYFGWDPILPAAAYHIGEGVWIIVRPPGTLGYVSYFATWLLIAAFLSLALAGLEKTAAWRGFAIGTSGLSLAAMLLTGTRAALLGLAVGVSVWLYHRGFRITRRMMAATGVVALAVVAFYFSPPGWQLRSRSRWFAEDPWGGARTSLWRDSLRMAVHRLPLGYGPEVFTATFPLFESTELAAAYPDFAHESPHNVFLDALIAQGIPGLLLLGAFCIAGFRAAWQSGNSLLAAAIAAGIVSQQFTVLTAPTAVILFVAIALAVSRRERPTAPVWRIWLAPVAIALVYCAIRLTVADHELALVKRAIDSGDARAAATHYDRYTRWRFPGTSADLWYSRALMDLAQKKPDLRTLLDAGEAAVHATKTAEEPFSAWYSLATIYGLRNDAPRTESSLRAAIAAHPNWFKPHWMLAQLLRIESRLEEAEREAMLGAVLNGGKNPEVEHTLAEIRSLRSKL